MKEGVNRQLLSQQMLKANPVEMMEYISKHIFLFEWKPEKYPSSEINTKIEKKNLISKEPSPKLREKRAP